MGGRAPGPFEAAQVLLARHRALGRQQFARPVDVARLAGLLRQVDLRGVESAAERSLPFLGAVRLVHGQKRQGRHRREDHRRYRGSPQDAAAEGDVQRVERWKVGWQPGWKQ